MLELKTRLLEQHEQETGIELCATTRQMWLAQPIEAFLKKLSEWQDWSRCSGKVVIGNE